MEGLTVPDLVDNKRVTNVTLAEVLHFLLVKSPSPSLSVATAYFNLDALKSLEQSLSKLKALRLLIGKEPEQRFLITDRLHGEIESLLVKASKEISLPELEKWQKFLSQTYVEIRLYNKAFLNGKAYLLEGVEMMGKVGIVGSSNFTGAGLKTNLKLNAVLKQEAAVEQLRLWFENLWNESRDYKQEVLQLLSRFTKTYTPYEIYIKVL